MADVGRLSGELLAIIAVSGRMSMLVSREDMLKINMHLADIPFWNTPKTYDKKRI